MLFLCSAALIRWKWHSTLAISIPWGAHARRGFALDSIAFWLLLGLGLGLLTASFFPRAR